VVDLLILAVLTAQLVLSSGFAVYWMLAAKNRGW
jgi:hypothetical protein